MDKKVLRREITVLIDSIKEHSDKITPLERINQLELELILSKIKKLYEKSIVFNYLNDSEKFQNSNHFNSDSKEYELADSDSFSTHETAKEHVEQATQNETETETETEMKPSEIKLEKALNNAFTSDNDSEAQHIHEIKQELPESDLKMPELNVNTLPIESVDIKTTNTISTALNDKFSNQINHNGNSNGLSKKPMELLIKSIGINEKFLFIKELFKNDSNKFNEFLIQINELNSFEETAEFIKNNTANSYNWNYKSIAVINFMKLIEKRFQ
jgi:hypothetical protein